MNLSTSKNYETPIRGILSSQLLRIALKQLENHLIQLRATC